MKQHAKKVLRIIITVAIVVASVWYALHGVDLDRLWHSIRMANYWWALAALPVMLASHWLRAIRWKTLIAPVRRSVHSVNLFSATMGGYAASNFIPRSGEFLRPFLLSKREKIPMTTVVATVIVERFLDVLCLLLFVAIAFFVQRGKIAAAFPQITLHSIVNVVVIPTIILFSFLILSAYTDVGEKLLRLTVKPFSENLYNKLHGVLRSFVRGLEIVKSPSEYFQLTLETVGMWLLYILPMYIIFFAFNFQDQLHLGIGDAALILVILTIGVMVAPTPGAIGVHHTFVSVAMTNFYGVNREEALAYAAVTHATGYLLTSIAGGLYLLRENVKEIPEIADAAEKSVLEGEKNLTHI